MAIYSCNLRSVGRTTHAEGTAGAHARYIGRDRAAPEIHCEHMPRDPQAARTWLNRAERADRVNARVIDKIRIALPRELDEQQRAALVREYMADLTGGRVPWYAAIHQTGCDAHNPHAHIIVRDRDIETGKRVLRLSDSAKDREKAGLTPKAVEWVRKRWEHHANHALERAGHDARIDRRSLEAQGIDRTPQIHVGPRAQHIDKAVSRPASQERPETAWWRSYRESVPYPMIDAGRTRREANAEIIDFNLEKDARSADFATRETARFERDQRTRDRTLESRLIADARRRTMEARQARGDFRGRAAELRKAWQDEARAARAHVQERFSPAFAELKARQAEQRRELKDRQSALASRLLSVIDITGGTKRRHEAARKALAAAHRDERAEHARYYRTARAAQLEAVRARYQPLFAELKMERGLKMSALDERHYEAEERAEAERQAREAEREQQRLLMEAAVKKLEQRRKGQSRTRGRSRSP